jgi:hypothetical protein
VTAWLFFRWNDHRRGRAPWPGPHRGPADPAGGPPARGARAGSSAGGYESAALFSSPRSATHPWGPMAGARPSWPGSSGNGTNIRLHSASPKGACRVEYRCAAIPYPKVPPGRLGCDARGSKGARAGRCGLGRLLVVWVTCQSAGGCRLLAIHARVAVGTALACLLVDPPAVGLPGGLPGSTQGGFRRWGKMSVHRR